MALTAGAWDFRSEHVGENEVYNGKDFISSESILVCSVPAASQTTVNTWIPIGLLEQATLQQNKQVNQLFEIGSKKSFVIPGRTLKRLNLSRILFNGDSLMNVISKANQSDTDADNILGGGFANPLDGAASSTTSTLFIDLASAFFNQPLDLGFVIHDQEDNQYGAFRLSGCYIQSHQMSLSGQQTIVMENVSMVVDDIIPEAYEPEAG